jgi:hypothetical protein
VFGCLVYVLDATLQDGHKLPKWAPRARLGVFLGFLTLHSSQVPLVMNVDAGKISPQIHVIFDDKFEMVLSMAVGDSIDDQWKLIFHLKWECFEDGDFDEDGNAILPPLTSIFQQDDVVPDVLSPLQWNFDPNSSIPQMDSNPLAQILLLIKLIQKSLHVMTSPATILNYVRIQRELLNRQILLQRELLKTP